MSAEQEHIYHEEEKILAATRDLLKNKDVNEAGIREKLEELCTHYEDLLNNAKLITSISDRFQEKLKSANDQLKLQADEINRINLELDADNRALKGDLTELTKARVTSREVDYKEFAKAYPDRIACLSFLAEVKWENGYRCKKCGNKKYCEGKTIASRRCTKCRYDESAGSYTVFHKCKFDLSKAFYIALMVTSESKISSYQLSRDLDLRQKTCWSFRQKILDAMQNSKIKDAMNNHGWTALIMHSP